MEDNLSFPKNVFENYKNGSCKFFFCSFDNLCSYKSLDSFFAVSKLSL